MMTRLMWTGLAATVLLGVRLTAQKPQAAETLLQTAIKKEVVDGDLKGAIEQYKKVVQSGNRSLAAQALVRMAECYQKLGDSESRKIYERIVREYADQKDAVTTARARLGTGNGAGTLAKRLLCTECGDYEATMTIDGHFVAFTDWDSADIAIRDMATGQVKRLMAKTGTFKDSPAFVEEPVLSPDLRQVAYLWHTRGNPEVNQLRVMPNEPGAKPRILVESTPETRNPEPVGWSPDGKSILANVGNADRTSQLAWVSAADGALKTIKSQIRFKGAKTIDPKVSPDGRYIAYAAVPSSLSDPSLTNSNPQNVHIYVLAADGSSETEVVKTAGINTSPVWTPDGKHLVFLSDRGGAMAVWSVAIENGRAAGSPALVNSSLGAYPDAVWPIGVTRSGSFYYVLEPKDFERISILEIDNAGRKVQGKPQPVQSLVGRNPSWSPDGKYIAFMRHHPGVEGAWDLVIQSLETGDERMLPPPPGGEIANTPVWFHDSKGILIDLVHDGALTGVYRVDLASGQFKQILDGNVAKNGAPNMLSPDDKTLYIFREGVGAGIVAIDLATGKDRTILTAAAPGRMSHWLSPDGRKWVVWRSDFQARKTVLATLDADGGNFREIYNSDFTTTFTHLAWTRDGRAILFKRQDQNSIMRISVEGGAPEFTGFEVPDTMYKMDISADGSRLAYSSEEKRQELWSLDSVLSALK